MNIKINAEKLEAMVNEEVSDLLKGGYCDTEITIGEVNGATICLRICDKDTAHNDMLELHENNDCIVPDNFLARLELEQSDLSSRLAKLDNFLNSEKANSLDQESLVLLSRQSRAMLELDKILCKRLASLN
ncbi:hypothetical protein vBVpaS1601_3 [Vibrio phage vB_VpaS_1601]|uniref:hypothetical protein n=1 Tax=Vibrio phage SHOU24 TaxID=1414739 RepID=UPI0003ED25AA|nr:hypothetical protein SHOU24_83 [Vibrio phage SHOU24]AHI61280.1 hypothetical protein SHOU24_83 [Vibrio phage SHOU24]WHM52696.1 hypothetical protein vBVpaP1601_3 [Vibrio phage vB_VpaP_1601]